jgi:hypothetical protein
VIADTPDLSSEATDAAGAVVAYALPLATDSVDGTGYVVCEPPSGATFPLGDTVVSCTASDTRGNATTRRFTITVLDTTAPQLSLPGELLVEAPDASGAVVSYTVSATDLIDGPVEVLCDVASGETFAPGTTTVTCWASDSHGNTVYGSFTVTVLAPPMAELVLPSLSLRS